MQALADAYNTYTEIDRMSDIDRLVDLARYTAETWPDREEGDDARLNLGQIYARPGPVRPGDRGVRGGPPRGRSKWLEAQTRLGRRHWAKSRVLERQGRRRRGRGRGPEGDRRPPERAQGPARRRARRRPIPAWSATSATSPSCSPRSGKATEALKLLDPIVKAQTVHAGTGLLPADGGPAHGLHRHQPGPAGDRHHEDPGAGRRRRAA